MTRVSVVIPYRGSNVERTANLQAVRDRVLSIVPDARVILADSGSARFNRAASRNAGVTQAAGSDVVVIVDGDIILDRGATVAAIDSCQFDELVHLPFRVVRMCDGQSSKRLRVSLNSPVQSLLDIEWSVGGAYVTTPRAWWAIGGMDERFTGWGYEDTALAIAHRTIHGRPMPRHDGVVLHLWHPTSAKADDPDVVAGVELHQRYIAADGDREALAELMSTP